MANPIVGARGYSPSSREDLEPRIAKSPVDAWMDQSFKFAGSEIKRKTIAVCLLGAPALTPVIFVSRAIIDRNSAVLNAVEPDILGTGAMACLLLTLAITPMATLTRQRWFIPLRRWFGIMVAVCGVTDAILAAITSSFFGGPIGRLTGHTFLLVGLTMVLILGPLALTSNNRAQRWLGKYWKTLQKLTYVVWGLLFVHLALLEGFGFQNGTNGPSSHDDHNPVLHQRLYQLTACSIPLLLLRMPPVKRWVDRKQREGRQRDVNLAVLPLGALFVLFYVFIVNELIFKGTSAFRLQPVNG